MENTALGSVLSRSVGNCTQPKDGIFIFPLRGLSRLWDLVDSYRRCFYVCTVCLFSGTLFNHGGSNYTLQKSIDVEGIDRVLIEGIMLSFD